MINDLKRRFIYYIYYLAYIILWKFAVEDFMWTTKWVVMAKFFNFYLSTFFSITLTETAESYTWYFADNLQSFWAYNFGFS